MDSEDLTLMFYAFQNDFGLAMLGLAVLFGFILAFAVGNLILSTFTFTQLFVFIFYLLYLHFQVPMTQQILGAPPWARALLALESL